MTRVRLSAQARAFIQREAKYLRERNRLAAESFLDRIREARLNLGRFPEIGGKGQSRSRGCAVWWSVNISWITSLREPS